MRLSSIIIASALVFACGGSGEDTGQTSGGTGSVGGSGATSGTGGVTGTGAVSGSGNAAGTGSVSGSGGSGGDGASAGCCQSNAECNAGLAIPNQECVGGVCLVKPDAGGCWWQEDCAPEKTCMGDCVCGCGVEFCDCDKLGKCSTFEEPAPGTCCTADADCGGALLCVLGRCKEPVPDKCWRHEDCGEKGHCDNPFVCPCGWDCSELDEPGICY